MATKKGINAEREMLGLDRVKTAFQEVADQPPDAIIAYLRSVEKAWCVGDLHEDDVTLLVLKAGTTSRNEREAA